MTSLSRELVFLILQFLDEEKFKESVHKLEQESGFFFNMKFFDEKALAGEWDEVERYGSGFTKVDDNRYSMKIFFEIRKQKYLEASDSLNWQHQLCKNPRINPDIKSLFTDHTCAPPNGARAPQSVTVPLSLLSKSGPYTALGTHVPSPPAAAAAIANALAGWMAKAAASSSVQSAVVAASSIPVAQNQVSILKRPRTPPNALSMGDYQNPDPDLLMKRLRPNAHPVDEVTYTSPLPQAQWSLDDLPRTVAWTVNQGATIMSMDFHLSHHALLLVGSSNGEITIWEIGLRERLVSKPFKIWDMSSRSMAFQLCIWSTDTWEKRKSISIQLPTGKAPAGDTRVQFHCDQIHLLVFHETQTAIYYASKSERILQWVPQEMLSAPISCASYYCNSQLIYASFGDGNVAVFDADTLRLRWPHCSFSIHDQPSSHYQQPAIVSSCQRNSPA